MQKSFRFDKKVCVNNTLNVDICSKFGGNFEEILGNPGEIPHIGWKTLGVYRVRRGFHTPTNPDDERYKTADLWNFEKIFGRCY